MGDTRVGPLRCPADSVASPDRQGAAPFMSHGASNRGNEAVSPAFTSFDLKTGASNRRLDFCEDNVHGTAANK